MSYPFSSVLTIGTFDTPHVGHAILVEHCKKLAPRVVVGVNSDAFVKRYKGVLPLYNQEERMDMMSLLGAEVVLNDGPGYWLIRDIKPVAVVIGSDWLAKDYLKQIGVTAKMIQDWGISLIYLPYTEGISTGDIKTRMNNREQEAHSG